MRKSFDGLCALVEDVIRAQPMSGHLFLFRSRGGDRLKILWYDRTGYCIWYKRLQKGTFRFPPCADDRVEIDARDLMMILEGLDHRDVKKRPVYSAAQEP